MRQQEPRSRWFSAFPLIPGGFPRRRPTIRFGDRRELRRNAEHNQYALTADQPNLSSGPVNQPSLDPITPASCPLRINPPEPAALRRLCLHTLVDREPSSPHRRRTNTHNTNTGTHTPFCLNAWLSSVIPLLMALLPQRSAVKAGTFNGRARRDKFRELEEPMKRNRKKTTEELSDWAEGFCHRDKTTTKQIEGWMDKWIDRR